MNTGFFPSSIRRFVQTRLTSVEVGMSYRSAVTGWSAARWMMALRITGGSSPALTGLSPARWSGRTVVRAGPWPRGPDSERVVEVDDDAYPTARHPDPDPDTVVHRVHQVHVMATAVRPLAL